MKRLLMLLRDLADLDCSRAQAWAVIAASARGKRRPEQIPLGKIKIWQSER